MGFTRQDLDKYMLSDDKFLITLSMLKAMIDPDSLNIQSINQTETIYRMMETEFSEHYLIHQKFMEFQVEHSLSQDSGIEVAEMQVLQYLSEMILNCERFEQFRQVSGFQKTKMGQKTHWKAHTQGEKRKTYGYSVAENGYMMFHQHILGVDGQGSDFTKLLQEKYGFSSK